MTRRDFLSKGARHIAATATLGALSGCSRFKAAEQKEGAAGGARTPSSARIRQSHGDTFNGIDELARQHFAPLKGLRLGLITNHTGHDRQRRATIDLLKSAPDVRLTTLFGPEHGIRGEFDATVGDTTDTRTGLPVFSLYGERRVPTPEQLRDLDALVYDIQDIGCRFYTYPSTMGLCLEAAAQAGLKFVVLDRVNPINGVAVEGPVHRGKRGFTAFHHVPLRHGMTVAELARMFKAEQNLNVDLSVIAATGWRRDEWFDETGLPWTNPSPNMRSLPAATLYPGLGLHESTLSVGRGTDKPFEIVGAPYIDELRFAAELREANLPGIGYVPIRFTPTYSTFKDKPCAGVAFIITDRDKLNAVDLGITVALVVQKLWPNDFALSKVNSLLQDPSTIDRIKAGKSLDEVRSAWAADVATFQSSRRKYLLY